MNVDAIREFCLAFPQAMEKLQWDDNLCFKIGEKIFVMLGLDNPRLCLKCSPESFSELIEREDIRPAPYVGRYKWVMLDRLDALRWDELQDLIRHSYEIVAAKAPGKKAAKKKRPSKGASRKKGPRKGREKSRKKKAGGDSAGAQFWERGRASPYPGGI